MARKTTLFVALAWAFWIGSGSTGVVARRGADAGSANPLVNAGGDAGSQTAPTLIRGAGGVLVSAFSDGVSGSAWARSTTHGATWAHQGSTLLGANPVLARDEHSDRVYLLARHAVFQTVRPQLRISSDGGASFAAAVTLGIGNGDGPYRHSLAVDNFPGTGRGNLYVAASSSQSCFGATPCRVVWFQRSLDGGATWGDAGVGPLTPEFMAPAPRVVVGPDHAVYVFWSFGGRIGFRKSTDFGVSFGPEQIVDAAVEPLTVSVDVAVNPVSGELYLAYEATAAETGLDVVLRRSGDGGATWSPAVALATATTARDQFGPSLAVSADGRRVWVGWYDARLGDGTLVDYFGAIGRVEGPSIAWGPNLRVSRTSFPAVPAVSGSQAVAGEDAFHVVWTDNRGAAPSDIRSARIPFAANDPDVDQNGSIDLLWQHPLGHVVAWLMDGAAYTGESRTVVARSVDWRVVASADFNADQMPDLLWQHADGRVTVWFMSAMGFSGDARSIYPFSTEWLVAGTADFNNDAQIDLIWQHPGGAVSVWLMQGTDLLEARGVTGATDWLIVGAADFNHDARPDLLWQHPSGPVAVWLMAGTAFTGDARSLSAANMEWHVVGARDLNGDQSPDLVWQHPTGRVAVWFLNGTNVTGDARSLYGADTEWRLVGRAR